MERHERAKKKEWKCKKCRGNKKKKEETEKSDVKSSSEDYTSSEEDSDTTETPTQSQRKNMNGKGRKVDKSVGKIESLEKKVLELIRSVGFLMNENEDIKKENEIMKEEMKEWKKVISEMKHNEQLTKKMAEETKHKVMKQSQYDRNKNIEICGLEQKEGENLEEIIGKISKILKIENFTAQDIEKMHRIPSRSTKRSKQSQSTSSQHVEGRPENVVVQFKERKKRDTWMEKKRNGLTNKDIFENGSDAKIYVNDHLTPEYKRLLMEAKERSRQKKWKYTWVKEGKILCRKVEGSQVVVIEKGDDLVKIE